MRFFATLGFIALLFSCASLRADEVVPDRILEKVDAIRAPSNNFVFSVALTNLTATAQTQNEFEVWVRERKKSLVLYRQPVNQRGRALLLDGSNMWIYIPGTSKPLRISAQQQLVGAVSNADVARVVFDTDYTAERLERVTLAASPALKLYLRAKEKNVSYQTIHLWVTDKDYRPLQAEFFSMSGKLIKTIGYESYREILGAKRPTVLRITDAIDPTRQATLVYSNFKIADTPAEYYQPSYLSRLESRQ